MAGDWIKMRTDLQTHPKIVRILSATQSDKFRVIGGLHAVWSVFDQHSSSGQLFGYTPELMDQIIGWPGFAQAMINVGWLFFDGAETLAVPEFCEHNGKSAKRRAEDQKRKRDARNDGQNDDDCPQFVRNLSANDGAKKRTREEREKKSKPPSLRDAPLEGKKSKSVSFSAWMAEIKTASEKPVSSYATLWEYAETVGIDREWVQIAWLAFVERYSEDEKARRKRYIDWRRVFLRAVKENWFGLWFWSEAEKAWRLSSKGVAADMATREAA